MSTQNQRPMSILPAGMDGRAHNESRTYLEDWETNGADMDMGRSLGRKEEPSYSLQRASMRNPTLRTVTPENRVIGDTLTASPTNMQHSSPRSIPGGEKPKDRRAGLVFEDAYRANTLEPKRSGPPVSFQSSRPRTRTLEEPHNDSVRPQIPFQKADIVLVLCTQQVHLHSTTQNLGISLTAPTHIAFSPSPRAHSCQNQIL